MATLADFYVALPFAILCAIATAISYKTPQFKALGKETQLFCACCVGSLLNCSIVSWPAIKALYEMVLASDWTFACSKGGATANLTPTSWITISWCSSPPPSPSFASPPPSPSPASTSGGVHPSCRRRSARYGRSTDRWRVRVWRVVGWRTRDEHATCSRRSAVSEPLLLGRCCDEEAREQM